MDRSSLIKKTVTQRAIAEAAGASSSLVSRVLSNKVQHISVTEEKILRIKQQMFRTNVVHSAFIVYVLLYFLTVGNH